MGFFAKIFGRKIKKIDIEKLLTSPDINNSIIGFDNYISELCDNGNSMDKLTEYQKVFYLNQELEREVNNGGFSQYFYNSSGNYAHKTIDALKIIGANKTASLLQMAIDQFPGNTVPKDRNDRIGVLEQIETRASKIWDKIDQDFYKYEDDLNLLNIEFIRINKTEF
jgi:hypothetical protein